MRRNAYQWAAVPVGVLVWVATLANGNAAQAAGIKWEKQGAFQTCLDAQTKAWLDARVELVANDDPAAGNIDDTAVATWAADTIKTCATRSGGNTDAASEQQFMRHMAHWRDHIYKAAEEIRHRGRPD
jgi:hypothetical protein